MRLTIAELPSFRLQAAGHGLFLEEVADAPLLLVGWTRGDDIFVCSAACATTGPAENWLPIFEAALPGGLSVVGAFGRQVTAGQPPASLPSSLCEKLLFVAGCGADRSVQAWRLRSENAPARIDIHLWPLPDLWQDIACLRGRLAISLMPESSVKKTAQCLRGLACTVGDSLRFRFPGSDALPTLAQLHSQQATLHQYEKGKRAEASQAGSILVDLLLETAAIGGETNSTSFDCPQPVEICLDFAAYVDRTCAIGAAVQTLLEGLRKQLFFSAEQWKRTPSGNQVCDVQFRSFLPDRLGHIVSFAGTEDAQLRMQLHRWLQLPQVPTLRPACALAGPDEQPIECTGKLLSPHVHCAGKPSWWDADKATTGIAFVKGLYEYAHYMQENCDDAGWGCAYRSLQTCISWYRLQHYTDKSLPSITEIQRHLKVIDHAHHDLQVGSKRWIGTQESLLVLNDYLGLDSRVLFCHDADDMAVNAAQILGHLRNVGTPVMMGVGQKAFTCVGLCHDPPSGKVAFLIVDPHYTGVDDLGTILSKGWVGWKKLEFFAKEAQGSFINICMPTAPAGDLYI
eukprot:TRINITY_DN123379_c0_g1_i1.p1 TRINITY_DN123379_c0_g1~~TRINITY_DN123379_c0_g1_i1.p1  ORF type:complete len:569 (-),score=53.32 TRINITY_DN123379_c0_g1_i1:62-1768(-)